MYDINIKEMMEAMRTLSLDPRTVNKVTGLKTSLPFERLFSKDVKSVDATDFLTVQNVKDIELVTWTTSGGKFTPIGKDKLAAAKVAPYDVKLMKTFTPNDLYERLVLRKMKFAQVYKEMLDDFLRHKKRVVVNQCHEWMKEGKITYQTKDNDNNIITSKQIDYAQIFGAIQNFDCNSLGSDIHAWDDPAVTDEIVLRDLVWLIEYMFDYTDGIYFNEGTEMQIWMGKTAYSKFTSKKNPLNDVINRRNFKYSIGEMELPVIKEAAPYYYFDFDPADGKYKPVYHQAIGDDEIAITNVVDGAYMIRDMKYMTVKNYDSGNGTPFVLTSKELDHEEGVEFGFCSSPLVFGDTQSIVKATVITAP